MYSQLSDIDRKMLKLLLDSEGTITSHDLSAKLGVPLSTVQRRRRRIEETFLIKHYSLDPIKFGYRKIDLLIYTEGGETLNIGRELLKRKEVTYVARLVGEHTIDLRVEIVLKDYVMLLDLIEKMKAMNGVREVIWTEVVKIIGRKSPSNLVRL
jgi:DNA-binding Lrp family transcriptional regulator